LGEDMKHDKSLVLTLKLITRKYHTFWCGNFGSSYISFKFISVLKFIFISPSMASTFLMALFYFSFAVYEKMSWYVMSLHHICRCLIRCLFSLLWLLWLFAQFYLFMTFWNN